MEEKWLNVKNKLIIFNLQCLKIFWNKNWSSFNYQVSKINSFKFQDSKINSFNCWNNKVSKYFNRVSLIRNDLK